MTNNPIDLREDAFFLARYMSDHMMTQLDLVALQPERILVLGSVAEYSAELLKKRYPNAQILMHPEASVDLIFANLYLPWVEDLNVVFRIWRELLQPEGLLMFSSLGPDTFSEMREALSEIVQIKVIDMHDLGDELVHARFADPVLDVEYQSVSYQELQTLISELTITNLISPPPAGFSLEKNTSDTYTLTYEIIYGHAWGPSPNVDHVADEQGIVKIPLSHLRRR